MHGIIHIISVVDRKGTARRTLTEQYGRPVAGSVPTIVRSFKSAVTRRINLIRNASAKKIWHRNYWEPVICDEQDFNRIQNVYP
jgi:REP-associated tyrosine transposase